MTFLVFAFGLCQTLSEETKGRSEDRSKVELYRNETEDQGHVWNKNVEEITNIGHRINKSFQKRNPDKRNLIISNGSFGTLRAFNKTSDHDIIFHHLENKHKNYDIDNRAKKKNAFGKRNLKKRRAFLSAQCACGSGLYVSREVQAAREGRNREHLEHLIPLLQAQGRGRLAEGAQEISGTGSEDRIVGGYPVPGQPWFAGLGSMRHPRWAGRQHCNHTDM